MKEKRSPDLPSTYNYVVSFGGYKGPVGAILLGKALGRRDVVLLLQKFGVSEGATKLALKELLVQNQHIIPDVTVSKEQLGRLYR